MTRRALGLALGVVTSAGRAVGLRYRSGKNGALTLIAVYKALGRGWSVHEDTLPAGPA